MLNTYYGSDKQAKESLNAMRIMILNDNQAKLSLSYTYSKL